MQQDSYFFGLSNTLRLYSTHKTLVFLYSGRLQSFYQCHIRQHSHWIDAKNFKGSWSNATFFTFQTAKRLCQGKHTFLTQTSLHHQKQMKKTKQTLFYVLFRSSCDIIVANKTYIYTEYMGDFPALFGFPYVIILRGVNKVSSINKIFLIRAGNVWEVIFQKKNILKGNFTFKQFPHGTIRTQQRVWKFLFN